MLVNSLEDSLKEISASINCFPILMASYVRAGNGSKYLDELNGRLEKSVVISRNLLESIRNESTSANNKKPALPNINIAGEIAVTENMWLYIRLNTLLPNCRYQTPAYLSDTLTRLLDGLAARRGKLPYYNNAMLIIDEHCDVSNRKVFDHDNKGYKAVSNTLKGRVFPDDDQFTLGLALISTLDIRPSCNIYVINACDAGEFFNMRADGYL